MKKLNHFLLMGGFIALGQMQTQAQCTVPPYAPWQEIEVTLTLGNPSDFITHVKPSETNSYYYEPLCQTNNAVLTVGFTEGEPIGCMQMSYYIDIQKRSYNCSGSYTEPYSQVILTTPITNYDANGESRTHSITLDYVEPGAEYTAWIYVRTKNFCAVWGNWHGAGISNNLRFIESASYPNAAATLNQIGSDEFPSFYGPITVSNLQYGQNVIFNATPSTCEDRYSYQVSEFNLSTWNPVPGTVQLSSVIAGQAPSINLSSFYSPGFQQGKIYAASINLGYFWDSETYFFRVGQADAQADIPNHNTRFLTVGAATYPIEQVCSNYMATKLNVSSTVFETSYSLELTEVNTTTLAPIGPTASIPTTAGDAGTYINLNTVWGPGLHTIGKVYRVKFTAGSPNETVTIYFEYKPCGPPKSMFADNDESAGDAKPSDLEVFPNPASDRINIKMPIELLDQPIYIQLIDMTGKVVINETRNAQENLELSLAGTVKGIYTLVLSTGGETFTKRIIKE